MNEGAVAGQLGRLGFRIHPKAAGAIPTEMPQVDSYSILRKDSISLKPLYVLHVDLSEVKR